MRSRTFTAKTRDELDFLLKDKRFNETDRIQIVEVFMDKFDYPWRLSGQVDLLRKRNKEIEEARERKRKHGNGPGLEMSTVN